MSKKVKTKTKTNGPLAIITLVFAIIAATLLGLTAAWTLIGSGLGLVTDLLLSFFLNSSFNVLSIINLASRIIMSLISTLILAAAAVLLIVNRRGSLSFIPMGLLTYMAISFPISLVVNLLTNRLGVNISIIFSSLAGLPSYFISMAVAAVFAVIIFVLAATVFKKLRPIPMALISVVLCVGFVVRVGLTVLSWISNIQHYELVFSGYLDAIYIYNVVTSFISSISGSVTYLMVLAASVFAIVAVIPYKNKVAVEDSAVADGVIETVAEETVAEEVATEKVAIEAPAESDAE